MKKTATKRLITAIVAVFAFTLTLLLAVPKDESAEAKEISFTLTADDTGTLPLVKENGKSDYAILFSSDAIQLDYTLAQSVQALFAERGVTLAFPTVDIYKPDVTDHEILLGQTNRAESAELLAELEARCSRSDDLAYAYAVIGEKLLFVANSTEAFELGMKEFLDVLTNANLAPSRNLKGLFLISREDYEEKLRQEEEKKKLERIEELKVLIGEFKLSDFGTITPMDPDLYPNPYTYPTVGQHPRLNLTADMLPDIWEVLNDPTYEKLAENFWALANESFDGILTAPAAGKSNYNGRHHAVIEAKALAYLLTGDELYAYEAIFAAKNYMLTIVIRHDLASDIFRGYGRIMTVIGEVYDWCYDLMTDEDRAQFLAGVEWKLCRDCPCGSGDKMTIGFPPTGQNAIAGHGTNVALHRDYLGFAIAVYDEHPDWWELIGGRFYAEYVPANNVFYEAGMNHQGTNNYVWGKYYAQLHSAWLVKVMSGEMPYHQGIEDVTYGLMGLKLPNGRYFQSGDGGTSAIGSGGRTTHLAVAAALFPSELLKLHAFNYTDKYTYYDWNIGGSMMTPSLYSIFIANGYKGEASESETAGLDLVWYYGSPMGLIAARNAWTEDAATVYMKIGELSGTNHDHQDAGTFQIYYKGAFTSESGQYGAGAGYGTAHWKMWHQATVAHNGLLVYNPSLADSAPIYAADGSVSNDSRYFYSGSQRNDYSTGPDVAKWTDGRAEMGTITGHDYYYDPTGGSLKYAYISGDISAAYSAATVDTIERRMLTVYTGDEEFPMFFTVYDYMKSQDASFKKSFLMHTVTEPTVEDNVAYFEQNGGKIVLTTLTEDAVINTYGGKGKTYWINDIAGNLNVAEDGGGTAADKGDSDTISDGALWGRVQIDNVGKLEDHLLNVIYVTDAGNENSLTPERFENENVIGMQLENVIAAFNKGADKNRASIEFETVGKGLYEYYFSGLSAGSWTVKVDGVVVAHAYTESENGLIAFTAPTGTVSLEPGSDVRPANSDDIRFVTGGGVLPEDIKYFYIHDEEYVLPEIESTEEMTFAGWYASPDSAERIYTIPAGTRGTVKVYAKFYRSYTEDYEKTQVYVSESSKTLNGFVYNGKGKAASLFKTATDEETDNTYLLWQCGTQDTRFDLNEIKMAEFLADRTSVTFKLDVALDGDNPAIKSTFRLRGDHSSKSVSVFGVTEDGSVLLGSSAASPITKLTNEFQTLTLSVDFKACMLYAFDTEGYMIASRAFTLPSAFTAEFPEATGLDYLSALVYIFDWYAGTQGENGHALRVDNVRVSSGMPENSKIPSPDAKDAIIYNNLYDSILPKNAPFYYDEEKETPLPEMLVSPSGAEFIGWYSDSNFTNRIISVPAGGTEQFNVYARWRIIFTEDYEDSVVDTFCPDSETAGTNKVVNGVSYENAKKAGASFKTVEDEETGNKYLVWVPGSADPIIRIRGCLTNSIGMDKTVTYRVKLALDGDNPVSSTSFRVQQTSSQSFVVFNTTETGDVLLAGNKNLKIGTLSNEFLDVIITVDFFNAKMTVYTPDGTVKMNQETGEPLTVGISKPSKSEAKDLVDFINYTQYTFSWQDTSAEADTAIRIDDLQVLAGPFVLEAKNPD